jgi:hypothetical protein
MDEFFKGEFSLKKMFQFLCTCLVALLVLKVVLHLLPKVIFLFILLGPAIFVLADAQERKVARPILWGVFTLFTWMFGLIVYLLARPEAAGKSFCPHCGGEIDRSFHHCPWCSRSIQTASTCGNCAAELKPGWKFCPNCRSAVNAPAAVAPAAPSVPTTPPGSQEPARLA